MRVLIHSNAPWSTSGYGNQTALLAPRLKDAGHDVAVSCFYGLEGGAIEWHGIRCYPTDETRFGMKRLPEYARHFGEGDPGNTTVLTLMDVWVLLQAVPAYKDMRIASWVPVDHDPVPPMVAEFLRQTGAQVIAMTEFGEAQLRGQGLDVIGRVPHGIDTEIFKPDRSPERTAYYRQGLHIPTDAFVVGMVANNQGFPSRKSFPQVFEAFAEFHRRHTDAVLYVHADVFGRNHGVNLLDLARAHGIPSEALCASDQLAMHLGIPQEIVAGVYNAFDVLCMPSLGEGFGIPLIEAQACGCPVITTDWTAMTELVGPGWLVDGDRWWDQTQGSFQKVPRVAEILDALEDAYEHADSKREGARDFAVAYDVDTVFDTYWRPVLETLGRPREIAPLRLAA